MSNILTEKIHCELNGFIRNFIKEEHLKESMLSYVDFQAKKGFPFGELTILHYQMFGGSSSDGILSIASAIECLVLAFDIFDDIEDGDDLSKPWSDTPSLSLNTATALVFLSLDVFRKSELKYKDEAFNLFLEKALVSVEGQHKDLLNVCKTEKDYLDMVLKKSGSLCSLACVIGTVLARGDCPSAVNEYSKLIGFIGQVSNDILDLQNWNGKNDLLNKKYTLPIIYLLNSNSEMASLIRHYYETDLGKEAILANHEQIDHMLKEGGAFTYAEVMRRIYQNKVKAELDVLDVDQTFLDQLLKYIY